MRDAFDVHLGGQYPDIKELFLGGDFEIRKFVLSVVKIGVRYGRFEQIEPA